MTRVQVTWRFDTKSIPKGKWVNESRDNKGKRITQRVWHPDVIWIAWKGQAYDFAKRAMVEKVWVMNTYWIPDQKRFCRLGQGQESGIIAWAENGHLDRGNRAPAAPEVEGL